MHSTSIQPLMDSVLLAPFQPSRPHTRIFDVLAHFAHTLARSLCSHTHARPRYALTSWLAHKNGVHLIFYDHRDQAGFEEKLMYYWKNPAEARKIAEAGWVELFYSLLFTSLHCTPLRCGAVRCAACTHNWWNGNVGRSHGTPQFASLF